MLKSLPRIIDKLLIILISSLVFLVPFFFLPITTEYYEFNKQAVLAGGLVLGYILLALRLFLGGELRFVRTKLDLAIGLLGGVYLGSTLWSSSASTSFLGQHGVFHGGFLSLLFYLAWFYLVVQLGAVERKSGWEFSFFIHFSIAAATFFLSILAIFQYFEIYVFPWVFTHQRFWTPVGGTRSLLVYLFVSLLLLVALVLKVKGWKRIFSFLGLLITLAAVFLVSGWGGPARNLLSEKYRLLPLEVSLDWQTSWQVANSVLAIRPLLGSGPGTFFSDFTQFKPQDFNQKSFWQIRFNRAGNEWLEVLATLGLLGVLAWVYLWLKVVKLVNLQIRAGKKGAEKRPLLFFGAALLVFLIASFLVSTTTVTAVLFWTLLALLVSQAGLVERVQLRVEAVVAGPKGKERVRAVPLARIFASGLLFLICCFFCFFFLRLFQAELKYQDARLEFAQDREKAFQLALRATQLNPWVDVYQTGLATASLGVSSQFSYQASPSAQLVQQLANRAIQAGDRAIQLNPENVRNWENLGGLYQNLLKVDARAEERVLDSFNRAIDLDPKNPVLRDQLGNFFLSRGEVEDAANQFLLTIRLKQDWAQAHYDLAQAYKALGELEEAAQELQAVLGLLPKGASQAGAVELEWQNLISPPATPGGELTD